MGGFPRCGVQMQLELGLAREPRGNADARLTRRRWQREELIKRPQAHHEIDAHRRQDNMGQFG